MKFSTSSVLVASVAFTAGVSAVDPKLIPQFGIKAGQKPTGTGDCRGLNNALIPCSCPPDRNFFIQQLNANVAAGHAVNNPSVKLNGFPTGSSKADKLARLHVATVTLQNLHGPGVGCPQVATTFGPQAAALSKRSSAKRSVDPALIPQFGIQAGQQPTGTGDCHGLGGALIPCSCPPDRQFFIDQLNANVAAGHAVNNPAVTLDGFPTSSSKADKLARLHVATVTLQNLHGPGVGCPQVATTFGPQAAALAKRNNKKRAVNAALIPEFGIQAGQQPTGTGDCRGLNNALIPCSCPPDRNFFIQQLNANVAAGHAVNNPSVKLDGFPTGSSKADKLARLHVATVTLQNLHGPGVGCPQVATTFGPQAAALG